MKLNLNIKIMFAWLLLSIAVPSSVIAQTSRDEPVIGSSNGNHRLDCTVIRPWEGDGKPNNFSDGPYPVIGWTNGWGQGNVQGADQVEHYISGLYFWAEAGDYLVIAANQWSPRAPDIQQCLQWLIDESRDPDSDYFEAVDTKKIGLSGHSQGGGAALKAGDSILGDGDTYTQISTVVAMNPYGPSFVKAQTQNGQVLLLGGTDDGVTPTDSFSAMLDGVVLSGNLGGVQAELIGGTHCNPACYTGFGVFGEVSLKWWDIFLRGDVAQCADLINLLESGADAWNTDYSYNFICPVP